MYEYGQLLYLNFDIVTAIRAFLLGLDMAGWIVGHQFADSDADSTGYLLGGVSPSIVL